MKPMYRNCRSGAFLLVALACLGAVSGCATVKSWWPWHAAPPAAPQPVRELNVNVPALSEDKLQGWRITRQGTRIYRDQLLTRADPRGRPYYWIGGEAPTGMLTEGTDIGALAAGFVSITPVTLDLTAYNLISEMEQWINNLSQK